MRSVDVLDAREGDRRRENVAMRVALVTAVDPDTRTVTIALGGSTLPSVNYLASYSPSEGHAVIVLQAASQLVVLGNIA